MIRMLAFLEDGATDLDSSRVCKPLEFIEGIVRDEIVGEKESGKYSFFVGQTLGSFVRAH